jgi:hypothetical protein
MDSPTHMNGDEAVLPERLQAYWASHPGPGPAPSVISSWSGFPSGKQQVTLA